MPNRSPLRIAFVGTGTMARKHLGALRRIPTEHRVIGVYDMSATAAAAFAQRAGPQATVYPTLATLLAESTPNVVHICTPASTSASSLVDAEQLPADHSDSASEPQRRSREHVMGSALAR